MIVSHHYEGPCQGRHLLVLGAIHGNETCGTLAIRKIIAGIECKSLRLCAGEVTFIPVCNPRAFEQQIRYCEKNLNRVFSRQSGATDSSGTSVIPAKAGIQSEKPCYEEALAREILPWIEHADYLLDLHSMPTNGIPFVFEDYGDAETQQFVRAQRLGFIISGWPQLFERALGVPDETTCGYGHLVGTTGVTIECGRHGDPQAVAVAETAILRALAHLGIIDPLKEGDAPREHRIEMKEIVFQKRPGNLVREWQHLDWVPAGTTIAEYDDGEAVVASEDAYLVLPHHQCRVGEEWFYLGNPNAG